MSGHNAPEVEPVRSICRPLIPLLAWGLSPAAMMTIAGSNPAAGGKDGALSTLFILLGFWGGPALLLGWSAWLVYPMNWTRSAKVLMVFPITLVMCAANLFLAFGACALIDPPRLIQ